MSDFKTTLEEIKRNNRRLMDLQGNKPEDFPCDITEITEQDEAGHVMDVRWCKTDDRYAELCEDNK